MDMYKFARLEKEFPFIGKILAELKLDWKSIGNIEVKRGDRNLLEAKPCAWSHDAGSYGENCGHRFFWGVAPGETFRMDGTWCRAIPYLRLDKKDALPVGTQLLYWNRDIQFVVEVHEEHWDWEEQISDVVIYKMKGFDWRRFCRPAQVAQS